MPHRLLLDTSSLMYRAFFAMPTSVVDTGGKPINAVHAYVDWTALLLSTRRPEAVVHIYDHDWKPAPRVAVYPGYKGTRLPDPEPLPRQFDILRDMLDALGMEQAEAEGWEADDAIGALAVWAGDEDRIDIVTGDRDLIQLVRDPVVRVLFTVKGVSDLRVYDEAEALAKYGVPASRYAEFAMLRGDPSDGLPGVRGVGEKTARALINAYPSIDALLADALSERRTGAILQRSPRLRASIREAADYLRAMQEIVPVRSDVEVRTWKPDPDPEAVDRLAERYRLSGPVKRLREALPALGPGRSAPPPPPRSPRRPGR